MPSSPTVGARLGYGAALLAELAEPAPPAIEEETGRMPGRIEYGGGALTVATSSKPKLKGPVNIQAPAGSAARCVLPLRIRTRTVAFGLLWRLHMRPFGRARSNPTRSQPKGSAAPVDGLQHDQTGRVRPAAHADG